MQSKLRCAACLDGPRYGGEGALGRWRARQECAGGQDAVAMFDLLKVRNQCGTAASPGCSHGARLCSASCESMLFQGTAVLLEKLGKEGAAELLNEGLTNWTEM